MADSRCGSCSGVAMETRAAALRAQIGSWKKKTGKGGKKERESERERETGKDGGNAYSYNQYQIFYANFPLQLQAKHFWLRGFRLYQIFWQINPKYCYLLFSCRCLCSFCITILCLDDLSCTSSSLHR